MIPRLTVLFQIQKMSSFEMGNLDLSVIRRYLEYLTLFDEELII